MVHKKMSLAIWSCVDISAGKSHCHKMQEWGNTSPKQLKKETPHDSFFQVLTTGMNFHPINAHLSVSITAQEYQV